jgi:ATP-dependent Clp protease ATP-binding subunit ClpC
MNEQINIDLTVQVERVSDQFVRARPLGPWRVQVVARTWKDARTSLLKKLEKAIPGVLPTDWFEGNLPVKCSRNIIRVQLPPATRSPRWTAPIEIDLETFLWELPDHHCVIKIPAVKCTLYAKSKDLDDQVVQQQARVALIRATEKLNLWEVRERFANRRFEFHSVRISAPLGSDQPSANSTKAARKKTTTLRSVASDLSRAHLPNVYGVDDRVTELAEHFLGESPQSVLLVGPAGAGKSSLVHQLVKIGDQVGLGERKIWSTSGARIVSGMSGLGMWQQRCHKLIREAHQTGAILHLGSLLELMEAGKIDGQPGVASMIRQSVVRGKLIAIAECTAEQLAAIERDDPMLLRAFTKMEVKEAAPAKIVEILKQSAIERAERQTDLLRRLAGDSSIPPVAFSDQAIEELYRLHARYATYSAQPALPLRLMQTILEQLKQTAEIQAADVAKAFSSQTGLPEFLVNDLIPINLKAIEHELAQHVIGQQEPVDLIVNLLATLKARMIRPGRPFASLLFIGPTGVGKTEMAKAIAKLLYSDTSRMIRIDMSEYSSPWSAMKLIGRGADGDGTLTSPIREQPFSVVLLDEFEKADPVVFDLLLQLLGEGRLTDAQGRLADFRNAVVIMTSNLGVESYKESAFGFGDIDAADWRAHFEREVQRFVRPELLGRIDRIVPFRPLPLDVVRKIALRETELLTRRGGIKYSDASLEFTPAAIDLLSHVGYQPKYGARPLRRAIEQLVTVPLADKLSDASHEFRWKYVVDAAGDKVKIDAIQLSKNTKDLKDTEANVINHWQQLGRMAQLVKTCIPLRDLENDLERQQRHNALLLKKIRTAKGPTRVAAIREQLLIGQAAVDQATQLREQLLKVASEIQSQHLQLLMDWHGNRPVDWQQQAVAHQRMLTLLRQETENVLQGRTLSNSLVTLIVTAKSSPSQLEILWRAYRQLAIEHQWSMREFVLRPYDGVKERNQTEAQKRNWINGNEPTEKLEDRPQFCLCTAADAIERASEKICDVYEYSDSNRTALELKNAVGFALEIRGEGVGSWLENEHGIFHFIDPRAPGAKRRIRVRVSVALQRLSETVLGTNWLEPVAAADRDPRRSFMIAAQTIQDSESEDVVWAQGKISEALVELLRKAHEQTLWDAIGYKGIPPHAELSDRNQAIPF